MNQIMTEIVVEHSVAMLQRYLNQLNQTTYVVSCDLVLNEDTSTFALVLNQLMSEDDTPPARQLFVVQVANVEIANSVIKSLEISHGEFSLEKLLVLKDRSFVLLYFA